MNPGVSKQRHSICPLYFVSTAVFRDEVKCVPVRQEHFIAAATYCASVNMSSFEDIRERNRQKSSQLTFKITITSLQTTNSSVHTVKPNKLVPYLHWQAQITNPTARFFCGGCLEGCAEECLLPASSSCRF